MYTSTSQKFSKFIKQHMAAKIRTIRQPKENPWFYSRYNDDDQCVQAAIMIIEDGYRNEQGYIVPMTEENVLAEEIFLASDDNYLTQLCQKALEQAAECDHDIHDKIAFDIGNA